LRISTSHEDIDKLFHTVKEGCSRASGSGKPEAVFHEYVQPVLGEVLRNRGARATMATEWQDKALLWPADGDGSHKCYPLPQERHVAKRGLPESL
jgi:hypothetical protein